MSDTDFKLLEKTLRERNDGFRLTIIDTVARVIPGVDMSAPETVTAFTERCDRISKATGATTIGVHHQNKNGGMMGSTFFEANSDFVFEMTRDGDTGP
ncbi:MAG TPA: AAA family ATPase, partial [Promineifilum sp.]|nr:AAA family ATPase [Promineifilum sp.]